MNTPLSTAIGWGTFTVAVLSGLWFANREIQERRNAQDRAGTRDMRELHFEDRIRLEEEAAAKRAAAKAAAALNTAGSGGTGSRSV
eukprot:m.5583 g.5583  ORF g.5583 m.5583 type:complete len:86 (+) comp2527_c0_seq1:3-260(+)